MSDDKDKLPEDIQNSLPKEGEDYYIEDGFYVFTESYLKKRGYCCESGCRHCPFGFEEKD